MKAATAGVSEKQAMNFLRYSTKWHRWLTPSTQRPLPRSRGFRAKALVAFYEIAPLCAGDTEFSFEDAYPFQQLFTAVAEVCGLKGKMAATGYKLPDVSDDDSDEEGAEA